MVRINTDELRKAARAVYLATNEEVAYDLSQLLLGAASEIDYLRNMHERDRNTWKPVEFGGHDDGSC